eukprot:TRINITY_DN16305_c0_g1_i1.p1 TRINITY_DN16305_c0_g1~~TRINITY_DN16305_c0_g1_i1.p1  ORF type:complete len:187 (+),score=14.01 TRINITY_DN16305_c0_g1_i1:46-606(+)
MSTGLMSPSDFQVHYCRQVTPTTVVERKQVVAEPSQATEVNKALRALRTLPRDDSDRLFSLTHPPSEGSLIFKILSILFEIPCQKKLWRHLKTLPFELIVEHLASQSPEFTNPGTPLHMSLLDLHLKNKNDGLVSIRNRLLLLLADWCLAYYEMCPQKTPTRNEVHIRAEAKAAEIIRQYRLAKNM